MLPRAGKTLRAMAVLALALVVHAEPVSLTPTASITMTVRVAPFIGLVAELYDEDGLLVEASDPALPPVELVLHPLEARQISIYVPDAEIDGPVTLRVYLNATSAKRSMIEEADLEARSRGISSVPESPAIEFVPSECLSPAPTIGLGYPEDLDHAVVSNIGLFHLDQATSRWMKLDTCRVDQDACTVLGPADPRPHTSCVFRVMAQAATDLRRMKVYPNPFVPRLASGGVVRFTNLTNEAEITIYSIKGELVWRTHAVDTGGLATWTGTDQSGQSVASGVYLYVVTGPSDEEIRGKISLIR